MSEQKWSSDAAVSSHKTKTVSRRGLCGASAHISHLSYCLKAAGALASYHSHHSPPDPLLLGWAPPDHCPDKSLSCKPERVSTETSPLQDEESAVKIHLRLSPKLSGRKITRDFLRRVGISSRSLTDGDTSSLPVHISVNSYRAVCYSNSVSVQPSERGQMFVSRGPV